MIEIGDLVRCKSDDKVWVARAKDPYGRWRLIGKQVDGRGRVAYTARTAGEGDCETITPAPRYEVGSTLTYGGLLCLVIKDDADGFVTLQTPERSSSPLRGGGRLRLVSGNVEVARSALVLESLRLGDTDGRQTIRRSETADGDYPTAGKVA
jgi:hypothetical protein